MAERKRSMKECFVLISSFENSLLESEDDETLESFDGFLNLED